MHPFILCLHLWWAVGLFQWVRLLEGVQLSETSMDTTDDRVVRHVHLEPGWVRMCDSKDTTVDPCNKDSVLKTNFKAPGS